MTIPEALARLPFTKENTEETRHRGADFRSSLEWIGIVRRPADPYPLDAMDSKVAERLLEAYRDVEQVEWEGHKWLVSAITLPFTIPVTIQATPFPSWEEIQKMDRETEAFYASQPPGTHLQVGLSRSERMPDGLPPT